MSNVFFFDTYALIEIYKGNQNYEKYKGKVKMLITGLNILEYVYFLLREKRESEIEEAFSNLSRYMVKYDKEIIINTAKMKHKYSKEKLSFIDCIGYLVALRYKAKFLTGDEKFKDKENVEFVK